MFYNPYSLEGKTILVTGASSGIGAATAIECSKLGANVIITGRNVERLQETFVQLATSTTQSHSIIICDLLSDNDISNLSEKVEKLDGVVSNAGVNRIKPLTFVKTEDLVYVFQNNTFASVNLIRLLVKKKKLNKNCSLVFTSSVSAFYNAPGRALYSSSKAAEEELQKGLSEYPLNRYGTPKDIALAIIYFLSDASSWVTGASITIDGGFMLK